MHESTECQHGRDERDRNGTCNDDGEFSEEGEIAKKEKYTATKCCDTATENTDAHFTVCLSHFIVSPHLG